MKILYASLLVSTLLSCGFAKPATTFLGYQDSLGQYSFGYSAPGSARSEIRTLNGATRGAYSYVDGNGAVQSAQYVADGEHGFRVVATNLPEAPLPVEDTPEVAAARIAHLQALEVARQVEESQSQQENKIEAKSAKLEDANDVEEMKDQKDQKDLKDQKDPKDLKDVKDEKPPQSSDLAKDVSVENLPSQKIENADRKSKEEQKPEGPKDSLEVIAGRATQTIIQGPITAVPLIQSHLVVPQILSQPSVPIFRIAQGSKEIEPSSLEESLKAQESSGTPAGTALKVEEKAESPLTRQSQPETSKVQEKNNEALNSIIAPFNLIPLNSYSSFLRYAPPVSYVSYTIL